MPESATQLQSDALPDTQPAVSEPVLPQDPAPARWRVSRSALLLIGGPLAGALIVWLAISTFSSKAAPPPEAIAEQPAPEPAIEEQPVIAADVANSAEREAEPALVDPEPLPPPYVPPSAINEVTPQVPQSALNTISGTVRVAVRVTLDSQGVVLDAIAADPGPSRYFERLSVDASRKWTFPPANSEQQRTRLVKFNFTREGVTAHAEPVEERD